jgi:UDP-N-acetylmuramoyl-tripeptide--D-alanyl-D-alanine ligase
MPSLGERVLWLRARDYVQRYHPAIIGIAGSSGTELAKAAVSLAVTDSRHVRTAPVPMPSRAGAALAVLGATSAKVTTSWFKLLLGSRIKELAEEEPSMIVLALSGQKPGDIDFIARQLPLRVAVLLNTQSHDLHLYQNQDFIAHEYGSLIAALPREGTACLNKDDPRIAALADKTKATVVWFGASAGSDVRILRAKRLPRGGFACEVSVHGTTVELYLPHLVAASQLSSVAAALAAATAAGVPARRAAERISQLQPPRGSLRILAGRAESRLMDDSADATPESMLGALGALKELPAHRRVAVLGGIENLGGQAQWWHEEIGRRAAEVSDVFIAVGENMRQAGAAALRTDNTDVHHLTSPRDAAKWLPPHLRAGDLVLICGDREARMEEVTKSLLANRGDVSQLVK